MSLFFGDIFQVAWVVDDIEKHIDHWTQSLGVGPFFHFPVPLPFDRLESEGKTIPLDADVYKAVAISYSGDTMIELIEPGSYPSTYRDFLEAGRTGVHHLGTFTDRLDESVAQAKAKAVPVILEGELPFSRFAYLGSDLGSGPDGFAGTIMELIEPRPAMLQALQTIKNATRNWDGKTRLGRM